jgi:phenylacetate-CoA ligase
MSFKKYIFWLKVYLFRKKSFRLYKKALENELLNGSEIEDLNWEKRLKLIQSSYEQIPFYMNYYNSVGFNPSMLKNPEDWNLVPILEKQMIRSFSSDFINPFFKRNRLQKVTTGGSTGEPLQMYRDKKFEHEVLQWRMLKKWNCNPYDDVLLLWRIPKSNLSLKYKILNSLIWWPTKRYKFDSSSLSKENLLKISEVLINKQPPIIHGYVGSIVDLAYFLKDNNVKLPYIPLVWTTAAPLTKLQRDLICQAFGVESVLDQYGCSEVLYIGSNSPKNTNISIFEDFVHVEFITTQKNVVNDFETFGEMLITDLENNIFPLIRYSVGDRSRSVKNNQNGIGCFKQIAPVSGRISDNIKSRNGIIFSGEYLTTIFDDFVDFIKQFQIVQHKDYSIELKVVLFPNSQIDFLKQVTFNLSQKINHSERVYYTIVESIPDDRGKIRYIKNEL